MAYQNEDSKFSVLTITHLNKQQERERLYKIEHIPVKLNENIFGNRNMAYHERNEVL